MGGQVKYFCYTSDLVHPPSFPPPPLPSLLPSLLSSLLSSLRPPSLPPPHLPFPLDKELRLFWALFATHLSSWLRRGEARPWVFGSINGKRCVLFHIYINVDERGWFPKVIYVNVHGWDPISGREEVETIHP